MKKKIAYSVIALCAGIISFGCMEFTQKDYDLQEAKYEKERKVQEQQKQDTLHIKW